MPEGTCAELINGVVHMPSPVGPEHARATVPALVWLSYYHEHTPGVDVLDNASTALDVRREPQPDALLRILPEYGGRTRTDRRSVHGVPELIIEVAHSTRYTDLGPKFDDYERTGVLEYIVRALEPDEVLWFVLKEGRLVELPLDSDESFAHRPSRASGSTPRPCLPETPAACARFSMGGWRHRSTRHSSRGLPPHDWRARVSPGLALPPSEEMHRRLPCSVQRLVDPARRACSNITLAFRRNPRW